jgi:hypothetical protein
MDNHGPTGGAHCSNCGVLFRRNPRLGDRDQRYCGKPACQRARKAEWNRKKYADSAPFREAEKKRVRISRRTPGIRKRAAVPGDALGPPGASQGLLQLQAQMQEVGLLLKGMASHTTGIVNGVDLEVCLERYAARGRMLQDGRGRA